MQKVIDDTLQNSVGGNFFNEIEKIRKNGITDYTDAVVHFCEINNVEIEVAAKFIRENAMLKAKIREEAEEMNILTRTARLPI